ncbi:MAG: glycosyltransferase family 2 protein [Lachnospiraceae bacterium]|nr:glycosyltransferase family 2 protein [Lachnospiraceae bacterium]
MAKVSICIPAYRDARGVERLLKSISGSDYRDIEVIITDDTPDTSVAEVADRFKDSFDLTYHHNAEPLGPAGNWNRSIDMSSGEYIKIMHQDDWFTYPDSLSRYVRMLDEHPEAVLAYSGSRQVTVTDAEDQDGSPAEYYDRCISDEHRKLIEDDWRGIYVGQYIGAPSATIYRRSDLRFDPALKWLIDADFYMGLLQNGGQMVCSCDPLVSIGISSGQMTNDCADSKEVNLREYKHVFRKFDLGGSEACRYKLADICVSFRGRYSDISDCGITRQEYAKVLKPYRRDLRAFYFDLILRKLHIRKSDHSSVERFA